MIYVITVINLFVVAIAVAVHYEALLRISIVLPKLNVRARSKVIVGIIGAFIAHMIEIWIFGFTYLFMLNSNKFGGLRGIEDVNLLDCVYFSLINYTSIGYGDIIPVGHIRFLAGLEGLIGLLLIAWTAAFMYNEMRLYWKDN